MTRPFDFAPELRSDLLVLRPSVEADRAPLTEAASDPGIWGGHPSRDRYRAEVFDPYFTFLRDAGGTLVAREAGTGKVIGCSRYYASADAPEGIGIGFTFLVRAHWGGDTNFEMKRLMLAHLFAGASEAWFHIDPANARSQKATRKMGAVRRADATVDLGTGPVLWQRYRLLPSDWDAVLCARGAAA